MADVVHVVQRNLARTLVDSDTLSDRVGVSEFTAALYFLDTCQFHTATIVGQGIGLIFQTARKQCLGQLAWVYNGCLEEGVTLHEAEPCLTARDGSKSHTSWCDLTLKDGISPVP